MDQNPDLIQNVDTLFSNLENFTQNQGLIGKPVTYGDKTFIPVVSVALGYGSGNTAGKSQQGNAPSNTGAMQGGGNMAGGALGLGAKLNTDAVIVIDKDQVSMLQLSAAANATQFMDKIPQILTGMGQNKQPGQAQNQDSSQSAQQAQQPQQASILIL